MKRVEFRLSMPSVGSWNGRWSGEGRNYVIVRTLPDEQARVLDKGSWFYRWDDGWGASVRARVMERGERVRKSDGFSGYDWMVRNILDHGDPYDAGSVESEAVPA